MVHGGWCALAGDIASIGSAIVAKSKRQIDVIFVLLIEIFILDISPI
jgi:hypothetical protein